MPQGMGATGFKACPHTRSMEHHPEVCWSPRLPLHSGKNCSRITPLSERLLKNSLEALSHRKGTTLSVFRETGRHGDQPPWEVHLFRTQRGQLLGTKAGQ